MPSNLRSRLAQWTQPANSTAVRNYLTLRKLIGILGIALPWAMWLGEAGLCPGAARQPTISAYYYTLTRDIFVGILWALGVFLICYRGTRAADDFVSTVAGVSAILVALFPTMPLSNAAHNSCVVRSVVSAHWQNIDSYVHHVSAAIFFLAITCMSLFLFKNRGRHSWANWIYWVCGLTMLGCLIWMIFGVSFWKETFAVEAFGVTWLVNGIAMLKDQGDRPDRFWHAPPSKFA